MGLFSLLTRSLAYTCYFLELGNKVFPTLRGEKKTFLFTLATIWLKASGLSFVCLLKSTIEGPVLEERVVRAL